MIERYLTITLQSDWKAALRATGQMAKADTYQNEVLNFESPGHFFWVTHREALGDCSCHAKQR